MKKIVIPAVLACMIVLLSAHLLTIAAQNRQTPAEIPFEFTHNEIVVQVKIGGKGPYSVLIDTDTDPSAIDLATARELGLVQSSKSYPASGGGNDANAFHLTHLSVVELGNITV